MAETGRACLAPEFLLRQALRRLWRNRGLTVLVVLSLALGIGVNTALFSIADALFLEPLPVKDPQRLFVIFTTDEDRPRARLGGSYLNYLDLRERMRSFEHLVASVPSRGNFTVGDSVKEVRIDVVTPDFFELVGVEPVLGSVFAEGEDGGKEAPPVVLSHALWRKAFDASPDVVGRKVHLNRTAFRVVGVMPPAFRGLERMGGSDLWVPLRAYQSVVERPDWVGARRALMFVVVGRLRDGVSVQAAAAELAQQQEQLAREYPVENGDRNLSMRSLLEMEIEDQPNTVRATVLMLGAALLVLLVAIANVGHALLARESVRRKEMAVRLAMGARRRDLIAPVLVEGVLLVLSGAVLGVLLGAAGRELIWLLRPEWVSADALALRMNARVLGYALLLAVTVGLGVSLLPLAQAWSSDLTSDLKERKSSRTAAAAPLNPPQLRQVLVISQVALSMVAVVTADVFVKSLRNAESLDPGFDTSSIATMPVNPRRLGLAEGDRIRFYQNLQSRLEQLDSVVSVALSSNPLLGPDTFRRTVFVPPADSSGTVLRVNMVSTGYFETTDVLLLRGRDFEPEDSRGKPLVAVVNETMAKRYFQHRDVIGSRVRLFGDREDTTIIGVARDAMYTRVGEAPEPVVYLPIAQTAPPLATVLVRTKGDPDQVAGAVRDAVTKLYPDLPATPVRPIAEVVEEALWAPRTAATLLGVFALLTLVLASIGVYGLTRQFVQQRTAELGVRVAMGACPVDVVELIFRQSLTLIVPGLAIGAMLAFTAAQFGIETLLYGIEGHDLQPYLVGAVLLSAVALLASYLPARQATRMRPAMALREQ